MGNHHLSALVMAGHTGRGTVSVMDLEPSTKQLTDQETPSSCGTQMFISTTIKACQWIVYTIC
jgi:hypothetical protein